MFSSYAVKCSNCRCEYDSRSYASQDGLGARCPSCGYLLSHQQMQQQMQGVSQQQMNRFNSLSNQMNGMAGLGNSQLGAQAGLAMQQLAAAQFKPNVQADPGTPPELVEYERRVKAIKVEIPQIKETKMFGLWKQRTELRIEIERLAKDLEHHKKNEEMRIAEAVQKERLKYNDEISKVKIESEKKIADAQNKSELAITQLQGKATRDKAELQAEHAKALAEARTKAAEDYYDKMTKAMTELHQNGDKNSKFVQELALTLMKKSPKVAPGSIKVRAKGSIKELEKLDD